MGRARNFSMLFSGPGWTIKGPYPGSRVPSFVYTPLRILYPKTAFQRL